MPTRPSIARADGLQPVVDGGTRVLILGSLPGETSLKASRYYAHPRNAFWPLMDFVLDESVAQLDYAERLERLRDRGVGLWDVIVSAERQGSLDQKIRAPEIADLPAFIAALPHLRVVAFNGATASRLGRRALRDAAFPHLIDLPSSSPAHTRPFAAKAEAWSALRGFLAG